MPRGRKPKADTKKVVTRKELVKANKKKDKDAYFK
jgi:hypothetical protein